MLLPLGIKHARSEINHRRGACHSAPYGSQIGDAIWQVPVARQAASTEDCIRDLVRPLRDAGWKVQVNEQDDSALYMTVRATSGDQQLDVALLYSCGTDNVLYRQLAETTDVILCGGAPYHQEQYAHGIDIHVGPVNRMADSGSSRPEAILRDCISQALSDD